MTPRERALYDVQVHVFAAKELQLFLDTHAGNRSAFREYRREQQEARNATRQFEESFGPLTLDAAAGENAYRWVETPWPWEREA